MRIGLVILATGRYDRFLQPLLDSAEEYFFRGEDYDVYLFTDAPNASLRPRRATIFTQSVEHHPFPFIALQRFKFISEHKDLFRAENLFYIDVDMKFVGEVGAEILPDEKGLVGTRHPGFFKYGWGSRKTPVQSTAYVPPEKRIRYQCGAFQGGTKEAYTEAARVMWENILIDFETAARMKYTHNYGVLADMADETHWNAYLRNHAFKELSPSYCYPETWHIPFKPLVLALKKDYRAVR